MNIVVIAPHPDDEILGCGGTIARLVKESHNVHVIILTKGMPPLFSEEEVLRVREHTSHTHKFLGIKETFYCDFPAASLDMVPHRDVNQKLGELINYINPEVMFIPFGTDIHLDHQYTFLSSLVTARPNKHNYPKTIYAYETLSETNWNAPYITSAFHPNIFFDISEYLELKMEAFNMHKDQMKDFPHERSLQTMRALATLRGSTIHRHAAEAFVLIRSVI